MPRTIDHRFVNKKGEGSHNRTVKVENNNNKKSRPELQSHFGILIGLDGRPEAENERTRKRADKSGRVVQKGDVEKGVSDLFTRNGNRKGRSD